ncbi:hypothetical protein A3Q56_08780, partial [Intoshia linei]
MGSVGPCGYCSEIFVKDSYIQDRQKEFDSEMYEIGTIVFMDMLKKFDGSLVKLKDKHIDVGFGLERITAILNRTNSTFHTPELLSIAEALGVNHNFDKRVFEICDNLRTI